MIINFCISSQGNRIGPLCVCPCMCLSGFVEATLCTTLVVENYIVDHQPALCTIVHKEDLIFVELGGQSVWFTFFMLSAGGAQGHRHTV